MASLKEVRARISSVSSTRKITSAMKLVSASKLRRAQDAITSYLPYQQQLTSMLENFVASSTEELSLPLTQKREVKRVAIVCISSNSGLCGAFNSNVIKRTNQLLAEYEDLGKENIILYPIGKRMVTAMRKKDFSIAGSYDFLLDKVNYSQVVDLVDELVDLFLSKRVDRIELVYNHFKNAASQEVRSEVFLPIAPVVEGKRKSLDYILEPSKEEVVAKLLPKVVRLRLYSAILDSLAAEHGARTTAMQVATDNAGELIQELTLMYNKARQAAITSEIIDIVGGSEGLK